jgi:hypothetical protein
VGEKTRGRKLINHPVVCELRLDYETFALPDDPEQLLVTYTAPDGSETAERLLLLASWAQPSGSTAVSTGSTARES